MHQTMWLAPRGTLLQVLLSTLLPAHFPQAHAVPSSAHRDAAAAGPQLDLIRAIHNGSSCGEAPSKHCTGLQYVVQARSYPTSPRDVVTTMRGGGVAVWRRGRKVIITRAPAPLHIFDTKLALNKW